MIRNNDSIKIENWVDFFDECMKFIKTEKDTLNEDSINNAFKEFEKRWDSNSKIVVEIINKEHKQLTHYGLTGNELKAKFELLEESLNFWYPNKEKIHPLLRIQLKSTIRNIISSILSSLIDALGEIAKFSAPGILESLKEILDLIINDKTIKKIKKLWKWCSKK